MKVTGYASTPDLDHAGHIVAMGAFNESIRNKGVSGPKGVKLLFSHDHSKPLGSIQSLKHDNIGLFIEAEIEEGISYGNDVALAVKAAGGLNYSVGFMLLDVDITDDEILIIKRGELLEVSVVTFPCNPEATMVSYSDVRTKGQPTSALMTDISNNLKQLKELFK